MVALVLNVTIIWCDNIFNLTSIVNKIVRVIENRWNIFSANSSFEHLIRFIKKPNENSMMMVRLTWHKRRDSKGEQGGRWRRSRWRCSDPGSARRHQDPADQLDGSGDVLGNVNENWSKYPPVWAGQRCLQHQSWLQLYNLIFNIPTHHIQYYRLNSFCVLVPVTSMKLRILVQLFMIP